MKETTVKHPNEPTYVEMQYALSRLLLDKVQGRAVDHMIYAVKSQINRFRVANGYSPIEEE